MSRTLVTYFSASGITAKIAENLADAIGAHIHCIEPKIPYTEANLNWMDKQSRSSVEMNDPASRPEIARKRDDMDNFDVIFVGFPIWWYVAPTIINTFLESYDFAGKTIVVFAISGGSGMGKKEVILSNPKCCIFMETGSSFTEPDTAFITICFIQPEVIIRFSGCDLQRLPNQGIYY